KSRAFLAGLIGAAANVGYFLIAVLGLAFPPDAWRVLMFVGAVPALLTFFIRLFVPESERWQEEKTRGATSHWQTRDLFGVLIGAAAGIVIIVLWAAEDLDLAVRIIASIPAVIIATLGYLYPVMRYVGRAQTTAAGASLPAGQTVGRLLLGAAISGVALLGTW